MSNLKPKKKQLSQCIITNDMENKTKPNVEMKCNSQKHNQSEHLRSDFGLICDCRWIYPDDQSYHRSESCNVTNVFFIPFFSQLEHKFNIYCTNRRQLC